MIYKGKTFLIVGISASGRSAARLLLSKGASVCLYDDCPIKDIEPLIRMGAVDVSGSRPDQLFSRDIYLVIKSPGVPRENPIIERAYSKRIPVISEIELGWYNYRGTVLAVTGTNGKSTVTALINHILCSSGKRSYLCGNYGVPFTEYCLMPSESFCCTEVSSFQLEDCYEFKPHIAAILNIAQDHINRHHTMEDYIRAKGRILKNQKRTEYSVLNFDCCQTRQYFEKTNSNVYWFSGKQRVKGAYLDGSVLRFCGEKIIDARELKIIGYHNVMNSLAAICFGKLLGLSSSDISGALSTFAGIPHRLQYAGTAKGRLFYNDSKATNPDSTLTAVKAMKIPTVLLLGGSDKGTDFIELFRELSHYPCIIQCVFYGNMAERLCAEAESAGFDRYILAKNMLDAAKKAYPLCPEGGAVLLSPACASFDEFNNYEERGERFMSFVRELMGNE